MLPTRGLEMAKIIKSVSASNSILFICDLQDKFRKTIFHFPEIVNVSNKMINCAAILDIPTVATEQYPKGF